MRAATAASEAGELAWVASTVAGRLGRGGKIIAFGNGGSATDANDLAADCVSPPPGMQPRPGALALCGPCQHHGLDANGVGVEAVFLRQLKRFPPGVRHMRKLRSGDRRGRGAIRRVSGDGGAAGEGSEADRRKLRADGANRREAKMHRTAVKQIVMEGVLDANDALAQANRARFDHAGNFVVNMMSSPEAGKTALLERTLERLRTTWGATSRRARGRRANHSGRRRSPLPRPAGAGEHGSGLRRRVSPTASCKTSELVRCSAA